MLDYVLFHQEPFNLFCDYLKENGVKPVTNIDGEAFEVRIPEDLNEDLSDAIEDKYDEILALNKTLMFEEEGEENGDFDLASIECRLGDGSTSLAVVPPDTLFKITRAVSDDEFADLVAAIVRAVEDPNGKSHCDMVRERRARSVNGHGTA